MLGTPMIGPPGVHRSLLSLGICRNIGQNSPLRSTHPGGVNAGFADGSVRFLSDGTGIDELGQLAVRDDGQAGPLP